MPTISILFNIALKAWANAIRQVKLNKSINRRKEDKLMLLLSQTINIFCKVPQYNKKRIAFTCKNNNYLEDIILEKILFSIATRKIKYLGISLAKYVRKSLKYFKRPKGRSEQV